MGDELEYSGNTGSHQRLRTFKRTLILFIAFVCRKSKREQNLFFNATFNEKYLIPVLSSKIIPLCGVDISNFNFTWGYLSIYLAMSPRVLLGKCLMTIQHINKDKLSLKKRQKH